MHVVMTPIGSAGDVNPFFGLGSALQQRGHSITLATSCYFREFAERAGFNFIETYSDEEGNELTRLMESPGWRNQRKFRRYGLQLLGSLTHRVYRLIEEIYRPQETVVVAAGSAYGARVAQEVLGVPMATMLCSPLFLQSLHEFSVFSRWLMAPLFHVAHRYMDRQLGKPVNGLRSRFGLKPARDLLRSWFFSPQLVVGLFPDWFVPPQPDWPANVLLAGFSMFDGETLVDMPEELAEFMAEGDAPLVFAQSSCARYKQEFFETSIRATELLGRRAILLTPWPEQIPEHLPPGIRYFRYVPFRRLLPHACAFVHPGGIGSIAQGIAAGIPQLIVPWTFDQPRNSQRLKSLGISDTVLPSRYRAKPLAAKLDQLIRSARVATQCRHFATKLGASDPFAQICPAIERLAEHKAALPV